MRRRLVPCLLFVAAATACGRAGRSHDVAEPGPAPPAHSNSAPVQRDDPNPYQTQVSLAAMDYKAPAAVSCSESSGALLIPQLNAAFKADGILSEWADVPAFLTDPAGDAPPSFDLTSGWIAASGEDLVLAFSYRPTGGASIALEFGGLYLYESTLTQGIRRLFRVYLGRLQQFTKGAWISVPTDLGTAAIGPEGTEVWLSRRILGDVVVWPLWWVRAFTVDDGTRQVADSTNAVYFPSILPTDSALFTVMNCDQWEGHHSRIGMTSIQAGGPSTADRAFELARLAMSGLEPLTGGLLMPMGRVPFLATDAEVVDLPSGLGEGLGDLDTGAAYRAMILDTRGLSEPTAPFPDGPTFVTIGGRILSRQLEFAYPESGASIRLAMQQAIQDQLINDQLGINFWLDDFHAGVSAFLHNPEGKQPVPLDATTDVTNEVAKAKAVAFGHLLGVEAGRTALFASWQAAGNLSSRAPVSPAAALTQGLNSLVSPSEAARLTRLWDGWLNTRPYDHTFEPTEVGDSDRDGLPDYFERQIGTDPQKADTDGDGWTDRAEVILGTDPLKASSKPDVIVADGDFSDWQLLLPNRINMVTQGASSCPKAATINFFSAIVDPDHLIVGAVATDFWRNDAEARWEASLDFVAENKQFLLTAVSGELTFNLLSGDGKTLLKSIHRAVPIADLTIEMTVNRTQLGLTAPLSTKDNVKIKLRTVFKEQGVDHLCSETAWFPPLIARS